MERMGNTRRGRGKGNHTQKISCERSQFSIKEKAIKHPLTWKLVWKLPCNSFCTLWTKGSRHHWCVFSAICVISQEKCTFKAMQEKTMQMEAKAVTMEAVHFTEIKFQYTKNAPWVWLEFLTSLGVKNINWALVFFFLQNFVHDKNSWGNGALCSL